MDPASIVLGVVSGAAALAAMTVKTATYLVGLRDTFKQARLIILDLVAACKAFEIAWNHIHDWASSHVSRPTSSDVVFEQLLSYLELSKSLLDTLHADIERIRPNAKVAWRPKSSKWTLLHEKMLRDHCSRLHRQTSSLHLLLSTARL